MEINHEIDNVNFSLSIKSKLGMIRDNEFQVFDLATLSFDKITVPDESKRFYTISDCFCIPDIKNNCTWIINNGVTKKLDSLLSLPFKTEQRETKDYFYPLTLKSDNKKYIAKVDKRNFNIIDYYPANIGLNGIRTILDDNIFLSISQTVINAYELKSNKLIWSQNFNDLVKNLKEDSNFYFDPIIYDNSVYLYLTDSKYSSIFSVVRLNAKTGIKENEFEGFGGVLTKSQNNIYMLRHGKVQQIDLISNQVMECDYSEQLNELNISMYWDRFTIHNNLLYFIQGDSTPKNSVGIIDLESNSIVDRFDFPAKDGMEFIHEIKEAHNRITVQLSESKLMIMNK